MHKAILSTKDVFFFARALQFACQSRVTDAVCLDRRRRRPFPTLLFRLMPRSRTNCQQEPRGSFITPTSIVRKSAQIAAAEPRR